VAPLLAEYAGEFDPSRATNVGGVGHQFVAAEVVFEALSLEDGAAAAKGRFVAVVCRRDGMFADADTSDCRQVEGTFDTVLRKGA